MFEVLTLHPVARKRFVPKDESWMGNKKFRTLRIGIFRYLSSFKESNNLVVESLFVKTQGPKVNFRDGLMYW